MNMAALVQHNAKSARTAEPAAVAKAQSHSLQKRVDASSRQLMQGERLAQLRAASARQNPNGLPQQLRAGVEALSGMDMGDVVVHRNSVQPAQLNALAYAQGNQIHLGPGQEKHLAHEAWHVVQQRQGRVRPTAQLAGVAVNDNVRLEHEADVMGTQALQRGGRMSMASPVASWQRRTTAAQMKCKACETTEGKAGGKTKKMGAGNPTVQRVVCNPTNRGGLHVHDFVVNHLSGIMPWDKEYHVQDNVGNNRYADLVTHGRGHVYEVKSQNVGAATAQAEAGLYAGWMNATCGHHTVRGGWNGRSELDLGDVGKTCIKGHGQGGITYDLDATGVANCNVVIP